MADLHPEVQGLIDSLLVSGLPDLGRLAMSRVLEGDHHDRDGEEGVRTSAPGDPRLQLALADKAVTEVIQLEIDLTDRTREVFEEFRALQAFRARDEAFRARVPPTVLESIVVIDTEGTEGERAMSRQEKPLADERSARLTQLLQAWRRGVEEAHRRLETWS